MKFHNCDDNKSGKNDHGDDEKPNSFVFPMYLRSALFGG